MKTDKDCEAIIEKLRLQALHYWHLNLPAIKLLISFCSVLKASKFIADGMTPGRCRALCVRCLNTALDVGVPEWLTTGAAWTIWINCDKD